MSIHRHVYSDAPGAAQASARHIFALLEEALSGEGLATLAVSGGSTPKLMFQEMAKVRFAWDRVHLFWVDERGVPPTDSQSNYKLTADHFITAVHFPQRNVHRIQAELRPQVAAELYANEIREFFGLDPGELPHFDIVHRGVGPDAHTASLFPGESLIEDRESIAAAVYVEKFTQWRITLLPGVLTSARHTVVLACGQDKAEAVRAIFNEPYDPMKYPGQITSHDGRSVTWFMDAAAASQLE
ncbi:MAG TPA: 6-phosphogluconolactonase [Bryobacteraceae bacterium]